MNCGGFVPLGWCLRCQGLGGGGGQVLGHQDGFWGVRADFGADFVPLAARPAPERGKNEKHQETFPGSDLVAAPAGRVEGRIGDMGVEPRRCGDTGTQSTTT